MRREMDYNSGVKKRTLMAFDSHAAADEADRRERWAMTRNERLSAVETLRRYMYPHGKPTPRLQRLFESVERSSS